MGNVPLYKHNEMKTMPESANTGLWYDKFCNQWNDNCDALLKENKKENTEDGKQKWIKTVTKKPIGNRDEIATNIQRRKNLTKHNSGEDILFKTDGKFVTGMGRNHPVENGFTWHYSLGTPYIPGTSIKGVVRDYARMLEKEGKISKDDIDRIFGPENNKDSNVGSVIFLDAIPNSQIQLSADIMTPHYGPYYSDKKVPGDWHDPTPIPFLVVDDGQKFLFGLIPRNGDGENDIKMVTKWLIDALEWSGAGAKTNVGYGRFKHREVKSPADQWLESYGYDINDIRQIGQIVNKWEQEKEEKKGLIAKSIKTHILNYWSNPPGRSIKKAINKLKDYLGE